MLRPAALLVALALAATPVQAAPRSISVVLIASDGTLGEPIDASDVQVSLTRSADGQGMDANNMAAISLDTTVLSEPRLLDWISKGGDSDSVLITVESRNGATVYLLGGVVSRNVSISHATGNGDGNVSVSLGSKHLTVNGYSIN